MRLDLFSLRLERFKSFSDPVEIDFASHGVGLHFLRGDNQAEPALGANGAGKSTLWDALCWCLFGRTVEGLKNPDVVPWRGKGTTKVKARFTFGDVERMANPNKLFLDGQAVGQEQIESALGMDFDTFCATLLLGQGQPLFFDLKPAEKMKLFSTVLNLDRWKERSDRAGTEVRDLEIDLSKIDGELNGLDREEQNVIESIDKYTKLSQEWEEDRQARLADIGDDLASLEKELEEVARKRDLAVAEMDMAQAEYKTLDQRLRSLELSKREYTHDVARYKENLDLLAKSVCPTCGQSIKTGRKHHVTDDLKKAQAKLVEVNKKIDGIVPGTVELLEKAEQAGARVQILTPRFHELDEKVKAIRVAQEDKKDEANPYRSQVNDLKKREKAIAHEIADLEDEAKRTEQTIERTRYWIKGFKDLRLQVIDDVLQELELATNAMLDEVGLTDWSVRYDIEKETKSGTVQRGLAVFVQSPNNRHPVRWEAWSGGERQRLRLIGALALSDVLLANAGIEAGFEILDEPSQHLWIGGVRDLCDLLADRADSLGQQIWFVDHHAVESGRFASTLTVVRDQKGSRIDYGGHQRPSQARPVGQGPGQAKKAPRARLKKG